MPTQKLNLRWLNRTFNLDEWNIIESAWNQLVDDKKVKIGEDSDIVKNFKLLLSRLQLIDDGFKRNMEEGFPSDCKKYKQMNYFVRKHSNPKGKTPKPSSQESQKKICTQSDESMLFVDDASSIQQSGIQSVFLSSPD